MRPALTLLTGFKASKPKLKAVPEPPTVPFTKDDMVALVLRAKRAEKLADRQHDVLYALWRSGITELANEQDREALHLVLEDYALRSEHEGEF